MVLAHCQEIVSFSMELNVVNIELSIDSDSVPLVIFLSSWLVECPVFVLLFSLLDQSIISIELLLWDFPVKYVNKCSTSYQYQTSLRPVNPSNGIR